MSFVQAFALALQRQFLDSSTDPTEVRQCAILGYLVGRECPAAEIASALSLSTEAVAVDLDALLHMTPPRVEQYEVRADHAIWWSLPESLDAMVRRTAGAVALAGQPTMLVRAAQAAEGEDA
jgi:hypothetical protein